MSSVLEKRLSLALPGDGVYFAGSGFMSRAIALRTCSLSQILYGEFISHVGTVYSHDGQLKIVESTTLDKTPCDVTGKKIRGVQSHGLIERVAEYDGHVWLSRFNPFQRLTDDETSILETLSYSQIGKPYDEVGCLICGTELLKNFWHFTPAAEFCSELRLWLLIQLRRQVICPGRPGRVSPAKLARSEEASQLFELLSKIK